MLTKRLAACAARVTKGGVVCDVGTDHAYLLAVLLQDCTCTRAVATDIHAGPLEAARRTLSEACVLSRTELLLCDGLEAVCPDGITDVVIAGMGGEMIVHILAQCDWRQSVHFILQPMTKIPTLRRWLAEHGFGTWTESVVTERKKMYLILETRYDGTCRQLSLLEEEVGCLDWKDGEARRYAAWKQTRLRKLADQLYAAGIHEAQKWDRLAEQLEHVLEEESVC